MAQAPELIDLDKAYQASRPREAIDPSELLGLIGQAIDKANDAETPTEESRHVAQRALALAKSVTGEIAKSDDEGDGFVEVDSAVLADIRADVDGHVAGGRPLSAQLELLKSRFDGAPAPVDKGAEGDPNADADADADWSSLDLNEDPAFAVDKAELAAARAADDDE